jgi:hypothetical protein
MRLTPRQIETIKLTSEKTVNDVLINAPNLMKLPIHAVANREGIAL